MPSVHSLEILYVAAFAVTGLLTYLLTFAAVRCAAAFNLLDYPGPLKIHRHPIPFLGGTALFIAFWSVVGVGSLASYFLRELFHSRRVDLLLWSVYGVRGKILGIFLGSLIILIIGLADDRFRWRPVQKFTGQAVAALILMGLGFTINLVAGLGSFGYVITFIWILMIINAFNFIDSLDGHCTGVALISSLVFFTITQIIGQPMVGLFLVAFAGGLMGFLPHNFKPAKIFLGDNGSLFIGYMMAAFTLLVRYQVPEATYVTLTIPVLVFGVPIYDTLSVITVRLSRGIAPWQGDRNHFAHRMVKLGMTERVAVIFSYFISVTIGLTAILTTQVDFLGAILICLIFLSIIGVIAFLEYYAAERMRVADRLAQLHMRRREDVREGMEREEEQGEGRAP